MCESGCEIFSRKHRFIPNVRMYTILINGRCKIVRIDMAKRVFSGKRERARD